jgi:hypothetical protein
MKPRLILFLIGLAILLLLCSFLMAAGSITLPVRTQTQKLGEGRYRFTLPDNRVVEVDGLNTATGAVSLVKVIDKSTRKVLFGGKQGRIIFPAGSGTGANLTFPMTLSFDEMSSDDLVGAFLKLNVNDPSNSSSSGLEGLAESVKKQACEEKGLKWDPVKKCCNCTDSEPAIPDLAIDYFDINSTSAIKGRDYVLTLRIKNNGGPSKPTNAIFTGSPELISVYGLSDSKIIPGIGQGQSYNLTFHPSNNSLNIPLGTYSLHAVINPNQTSFKETNYQNNESTTTVTIIAESNLGGPPKYKIPQGTGIVQ